MPRLTYVGADGRRQSVEAATGQSVMQAAARAGVAGIDAECGGACACATCHVYVDERFLERIGSPAAMEAEMLDFIAAERRAGSRLACQLEVTPALDGLVLHVPARQR